jgi:hypothetical protein
MLLVLWAWGTGANGDLAFAAGVVAVGAACFVGGRAVGRWWFVVLVTASWAVGWYLGGVNADPDGYTWAVATFAPLVALFVALGTASRRRADPGA